MEIRRFLLVANEGELYGIELASVQEIRVYKPLTRLPHAPPHVTGILNVGGQILPVIDLRCLLCGQRTVAGPWHVIVLARQGDAQCGILVDAANEIVNFTPDQIEEISSQMKSTFFAGIANVAAAEDEAPAQSVAILDIGAIASFTLGAHSPKTGHEETEYDRV